MICIKCGYKFEEGIFCPECGAKYDEEEAKKIENREYEEKERRKLEEKEKRELEFERIKMEQERLATEKVAHEVELARQQTERLRIEKENKEIAAEQEKIHKAEEKEQRDLEFEKAKVARQQTERLRIEKENKLRAEEQEKKLKRELERTFNGILYDSIDEMNLAKERYNEQVEFERNIKKANTLAIWSFILSLATYLLTITVVLWLPSLIFSINFGMKAMKAGTNKRGLVIVSLIINASFILILILSIIIALLKMKK